MQCTELGGMEQSSLRLMKGLQERGHQCSVISLMPLGRLAPHLSAEGISAVGLDYRGALGWRSFGGLRRAVAAQQADALIMTGGNLLAMLGLGHLARGRRLLAMHFHHSVRPAWQWKIFYRLARARFDAISYPSDFVRAEAEAIAPFIVDVSHTIRNPLNAPDMTLISQKTLARKSLGLPENGPIIGNAGWLIPRKRFDVFIRVARRILQEVPSARFVIAGTGSEEESLKTLAHQLGIDNRITWLGWKDQLQDFYLALDVLLFNSDWDAFGNTPVEAMSYGVPVVASVLNGGLDEVICNKAHGTILRKHNISELADAVINQLGVSSVHTGSSGRARAIELSDPSRVLDEVEGLLRLPQRRDAVSFGHEHTASREAQKSICAPTR
jgi:glycosyltransferase involved in cell wall biosynthesis